MDFIQPNKRMINWGAILSGICLIAICFSIALCSLNDSSQTEGQITAMRYQENAVAANELLTQAFERDSNGAIIFLKTTLALILMVRIWFCFSQIPIVKRLRNIGHGPTNMHRFLFSKKPSILIINSGHSSSQLFST